MSSFGRAIRRRALLLLALCLQVGHHVPQRHSNGGSRGECCMLTSQAHTCVSEEHNIVQKTPYAPQQQPKEQQAHGLGSNISRNLGLALHALHNRCMPRTAYIRPRTTLP